MSTVCLIPARGGSKGIPRKNLYPFMGLPLVDWSLACARDSGVFEEILLSSDDEEILSRAEQYGARGIRRPDEMSGDAASSESALVHALESSSVESIDEVVFLQATSPLRSPGDIRGALDCFRNEKLDSLFSSAGIEDWFVWEKNDAGELYSVTYDWRERKRRQEIRPSYLENGSVYVFKPELLTEQKNRLGGKIGTFVMESWKEPQVDTLEQMEIAEVLMRHRLIREWDFVATVASGQE